jgi:hypothetical protein
MKSFRRVWPVVLALSTVVHFPGAAAQNTARSRGE